MELSFCSVGNRSSGRRSVSLSSTNAIGSELLSSGWALDLKAGFSTSSNFLGNESSLCSELFCSFCTGLSVFGSVDIEIAD
jgi:hypothetical protein